MKATYGAVQSHGIKIAPWVLLFSAAALLRVPLAQHPGLWADEIFSLAMATGHSLEHPANEANPALGDYVESPDPQPPAAFRRYMEHGPAPASPGSVIRAVRLSDTSPPLYYLALNVWTRTFGTSDGALRLFSTVWAMACLPLLWLIGMDLEGRRTAWASCILFAVSPTALYYSAEGRMYSLVWFLALAVAWSTLALARLGPRPHLLILWVLSAAAGLLTHYFFTFVLAACLTWLVFHTDRMSRPYIATLVVATALLVCPWYLELPKSLSSWRVTNGWLDHRLGWRYLIANPFNLAWTYLSLSGPWGASTRANVVLLGIYGVLCFVALRRGAKPLFTDRRHLIWLWMAASTTGPVVFDLLRGTSTSLIPRYALPGLPAALLLAALVTSMLPNRVQMVFLILLPLIWFPGIHKVFAEPARAWEPFPEVAARLNTSAHRQDMVLVHSIPSGVLGVARYLDTPTPIVSWVVQLKQRRVPDDIERFASSCRRLALVKIHDLGQPSPAEAWLLQNTALQPPSSVPADPFIRYFQGKLH